MPSELHWHKAATSALLFRNLDDSGPGSLETDVSAGDDVLGRTAGLGLIGGAHAHGIGFAQLRLEVHQPVSGGPDEFGSPGDGLGFPCDLCERRLADVIQKLDLDRSVRAVGVDLAEALAAAGTGPDRRVARDVVPAHYSVSPVLEKEFDLGHISRVVDDVDGPLSAYRALARLADNVKYSRV